MDCRTGCYDGIGAAHSDWIFSGCKYDFICPIFHSMSQRLPDQTTPTPLPHKTPAPDLDQLRNDVTGEYALDLFQTAVVTNIRYDDAGELLAWIGHPRGKRLTEREALNAILEQLLNAALSESAALPKRPVRQFDSEAEAESFIASFGDETVVRSPKTDDNPRPFNDLLNQCVAIVQRTIPTTGRPASKHIPTVKAHIHHEYLGTHWPKLADKFCDCGKSRHDNRCVSKLKSAVQELKDLMMRNHVALYKDERGDTLA